MLSVVLHARESRDISVTMLLIKIRGETEASQQSRSMDDTCGNKIIKRLRRADSFLKDESSV